MPESINNKQDGASLKPQQNSKNKGMKIIALLNFELELEINNLSGG